MADKGKRGLGRGMGALFGEDSSKTDGRDILTLPITKVEPRQDQPRCNFDDESLAELADSIRNYGLIQPITVRRLDSGYYQIVAGERRWRRMGAECGRWHISGCSGTVAARVVVQGKGK